jgi:hypothetical protein
MSGKPPRNLEASIKTRLLALARVQREEFQSVLTRYAAERFLYRLSVSPFRERFVLKGASLFTLWLGSPHRSTRDLDLLGFGSQEVGTITKTFQSLCRQPIEDDGLLFEPSTVSVTTAREAEKYAGLRVLFRASLGQAIVPMQVDIGFGDVITPQASEVEMPSLLGAPRARLLSYPRETVIAEKCEAMIDLGPGNSRLKDFYDLRYLAMHFDFEGTVLRNALAATCEQRGTKVLLLPPPALTSVFYDDVNRARQWRAFWERSGPAADPFVSLEECIRSLNVFLMPPLQAVRGQATFEANWSHEQVGWSSSLE